MAKHIQGLVSLLINRSWRHFQECLATFLAPKARNSEFHDPVPAPYWKQFNLTRGDAAQKRILVIGCIESEVVSSLAEALRQNIASVDVCDELDSALDVVKNTRERWRAVFIRVDSDYDIDEVVETLIDFRDATPDVPVILVGSNFRRNDFGSERSAISDITLTEPIRLSWISQYLEAAENNNLLRKEALASC